MLTFMCSKTDECLMNELLFLFLNEKAFTSLGEI